MESEWYVARDGETYGPFTSERMRAGVREDELQRDDLVWCKGMPNWLPVGNLPEIWQPPGPPPPPATVAPSPASVGIQTVAAEGAPSANQSTDDERSTGTQRKVVPRAGFILRHWRGEFTLAQSYWGVGFLLTLLVIWVSNAFGAWLDQANLAAVGSGIALTSFLSFLCAVTVWQLVGIWRAAGNHIRSTGRTAWGALARVAVMIGAMRALVDFTTVIWPMLSESAMLATGRDNIPAHRLRLLRNGTELELSGGMPFGTADALVKLLDAAPSVQIVHLNSIGGRIGEGYQIYRILRERNLATYTATDCVSACTIAFLGGSQRYLSARARLGFHSSSFGGVDQRRIPDINADLRRTLEAHGAPHWFIDKALSTSASSMWYPSHKDLIAAKIVTRIVDADQFGMSGIVNWRDKAALERTLLAIPLYALIKDSDPTGFKKIADRYSESVKLGKSEAEVIQDLQVVFGTDILPNYLRVAPDGVIQRYWRTQLAEMQHLSKGDAANCVAYAFPELRRQDFNINKLVPAALLADDIAALTELIKEAIRAPNTQKSDNLDAEFADVVARISSRIAVAQYVLAEPSRYFNDPRTLCDVLIAYYTDILSLPPARSGPMLRAIAEPLQ